MNPDIDVDIRQLHGTTSAVEGTAARVREAAASAPPPVPGPRWSSVDAAASAAGAAARSLRNLGAGLTDTADQIEHTIAEYAAADTRAATRLRAAR
ncbi:hypothetical protein [Actinoplanes siamensis]|uniref:Excreted virulence factor EspC (Type VII ESX diderm) n=1 Tax=Actinoplanes siamensis TaxID=1223317 RepID=A0A919N873_9ACTN|nr:hypothetical protein [Actinoplanes siamensis]GIF06168.1 hypothetical protein Asi03nite_37060 [Actinoplanes siamensis]